MISALVEKLLAAALCVVLAIGIGTTIYAVVEHADVTAAAAQVEQARLDVAQANANAAIAASDASATRAAFQAQADQIAKAQNNHSVSTANLASAVAANPAAAEAEVAPAVWDAIFGTADAQK